jgi:phosphatidylinositol glycan class O
MSNGPRTTNDGASVVADTVNSSKLRRTPPSDALSLIPSSLILILGLLILAALHAVSLLLFTRGFLLTRLALEDINTCNPISSSGNIDASCSLPATHSKLVFIVIDALRADFVLPVSTNSSFKPSPFHHNRFTLPARLTQQDPSRSFLSHFIADAPTTTLQRLKGLTTGSLPTFIDAGSNFAGERVGEDNWLSQAKRAGKRIAMVGDDTWLSVFPRNDANGVWEKNNTWPYDSFNVEDLDTVDAGVVSHLLPLLDENKAGKGSWDIIIAHTLGLDHAGHRFGPSHSEAGRKLDEAEDLLQKVVERLDDDTLLVVIGDHGMTDRGDHGGDSREEIDAALWVYSKGPILTHSSFFQHPFDSPNNVIAPLLNIARSTGNFEDRLQLDWPNKGLGSTRSVSQVDIVPTLSLLLGLPIPFGSLGLVIPELFYHSSSLPVAPVPEDLTQPKTKKGFFSSLLNNNGPTQRDQEILSPLSTLVQANLLTASQLSHYLSTYTATSSGSDFLPAMPELTFILSIAKSAARGAYAPGANQVDMEMKAIEKFWMHGRKARENARKVWARFDVSLMIAGSLIWIGSIAVGYRFYEKTSIGNEARVLVARGLQGGVTALVMTAVFWYLSIFESKWVGGFSVNLMALIVAAGVEASILTAPSTISSSSKLSISTTQLRNQCTKYLLPLLPLIGHAFLFASNSFTVFEDASVLFMLSTLLIISLVRSFAAPEARLRKRLLCFTSVVLICVRIMSYSTICREEQAPSCFPTFDTATPGSNSALAVIGLTLIVAYILPILLRRSLALSSADRGIAPIYFSYGLRSLLVGGVVYRLADWTIARGVYGVHGALAASILKTGTARTVLMGASLSSTMLWYSFPLCIDVEKTQGDAGAGKKLVVNIRGFANAFGSSYIMFFTSVFAIIFLLSTSTGQLALSLHLVTLLCLLEIFDSERDVEELKKKFASMSIEAFLGSAPTETSHDGPTFLQLSTLALLSHVSFFATGHQGSFSTIQWNSAFIGFPVVVYPISPILIILNTLGSHLITALSIPLFVFWNVTPTFKDQSPLPLLRNLLKAGVGYSTYQATVSLASALFAGILRRHLMVWKIFAPRFMLGGVTLLIVDVGLVIFAAGWASLVTIRKVQSRIGTIVIE